MTVGASQAGNSFYAPAASVDQSFMVVRGVNYITDAPVRADGSFRLDFAGEFSRSYVVEFSKDLEFWVPVATNTVDALGNLEFTDAAAANRSASFYRVRGQ